MKYLKNKKLLAIIFISCGFISTNLSADTETCDYKIFTKSDDIVHTIGSFQINNGAIQIKGRALRTEDDEGFSRLAAARTAENCLKTAISGGTMPQYCTPDANASTEPGLGRALRFIPNLQVHSLKRQAYQQLCAAVASAYGNQMIDLRGKIYTKVISSSKEKRRECTVPASYYHVTHVEGGIVHRFNTHDPGKTYHVWDESRIRCSQGEFRRFL